MTTPHIFLLQEQIELSLKVVYMHGANITNFQATPLGKL